MSIQDIHYSEANLSRTHYDQEISALRKLLWTQSIISVIAFLIIYGYFSRVYSLNEVIQSFNNLNNSTYSLESAKYSTVLSFLANHKIETDHSLKPDEQSKNLVLIIAKTKEVLGEDVSITTYGKNTVTEMLEKAKERPKGIKLTLPYVGQLEFPFSYPLFGILSVVVSVLLNLFLLIRQSRLADVEEYIIQHLQTLEAIIIDLQGTASESAQPSSFKFNFGAKESWLPNSFQSLPFNVQMIFEMATGILKHRYDKSEVSVLEIGSSVLSVASMLFILPMSIYLEFESVALLPQSAMLIVDFLIGLVAFVIMLYLIALLGSQVFLTKPK